MWLVLVPWVAAPWAAPSCDVRACTAALWSSSAATRALKRGTSTLEAACMGAACMGRRGQAWGSLLGRDHPGYHLHGDGHGHKHPGGRLHGQGACMDAAWARHGHEHLGGRLHGCGMGTSTLEAACMGVQLPSSRALGLDFECAFGMHVCTHRLPDQRESGEGFVRNVRTRCPSGF